MSVIYTAHAISTGGRAGTVKTDDGKIDFALSSPGSNGEGTNPEQLFAAGYSACFGGAVQYLAKQKGIDVGDVTIACDVSLHKAEDGFSLSAVMDVHLPDLAADEARELVQDTHAFCPYSKATRGNIDVTLKLNGAIL